MTESLIVEPRPLATPPAHPTRLVFFGTPEMAVAPLRALHEAGHSVALVVTRADKRRGRGSSLVPSAVKAAALDLGIAVTDQIEDALSVGADLGVVVAYGRIIERAMLEELPMVNLHFSLLPRWRGAAPVERAILAGDSETGVDLMAVEEGLDTGDIFAETIVEIGPNDTADELRHRLVSAGSSLLVNALHDGLGEPRPQIGATVYAEKLAAADFEINWSRSAIDIHRLVRVGGAWTTLRGQRCKIWRTRCLPVAPDCVESGSDESETSAPRSALACGVIRDTLVGTGEGFIELLEVQPAGKARQSAASWRNGARLCEGEGFDI